MNETIKKFLDDDKITSEEYNILFSSEEEWMNRSLNQELFNKTLQKVIYLQKDYKTLDLTFITFSFFTFKNFTFNREQNISFSNSIFLSKTDFSEITFPSVINFNKANFKGKSSFYKTIFPAKADFRKVIFSDETIFGFAIFYARAIFSESEFLNEAGFGHATFKGRCNFDQITFNSKISFGKVIFEKITHFSHTTFLSKTYFSEASFFNIANFSEASFSDIVSFYKTTFMKIDLKRTFIKEANFLAIHGTKKTLDKPLKIPLDKTHVANKESARILKVVFENQHNIPESNKYFKIEQDLYLDELIKSKTEPNKFSNLAVLYLNKYVSYFGTDWIRPLLVMFIFGFLASLGYGFIENHNLNISFSNSKLLLFLALLYSLLVYYFYHKQLFVAFVASIIVFYSILFDNTYLYEMYNNITKLINPFNIFKPQANYFKDIAMYGMLVKLIMATLIYQFIMAFRQNTRRK